MKPPPETEEEMMIEVFKYTNRVVNMIRPRKLLFMAIGVCRIAPSLLLPHRSMVQMALPPEQR
jgi:5'-3' exonuclease